MKTATRRDRPGTENVRFLQYDTIECFENICNTIFINVFYNFCPKHFIYSNIPKACRRQAGVHCTLSTEKHLWFWILNGKCCLKGEKRTLCLHNNIPSSACTTILIVYTYTLFVDNVSFIPNNFTARKITKDK